MGETSPSYSMLGTSIPQGISGARLHGNVELTWPPWIFADEQIQRTNHSTAGPVVQYGTVSFDLLYLDYRLACSKNIQKFSKPTIKQTHVLVEKRMVNAKSISASGLLLPPTGPTAVAALLRGCSCHHLVRYLVKFHNLYFGYIRCFVPSPSMSNHCMK